MNNVIVNNPSTTVLDSSSPRSPVVTLVTTFATTTSEYSPIRTTNETPKLIYEPTGYLFPYVLLYILLVWVVLGFAYLLCRYRQRLPYQYIIPRVFMMCSPRTVQFHYEFILRIGLASSDFNPEKHDLDLTVLGKQKNEVVSMTRLNTKTLLDEPLITNLSIIVYRLTEMPPLGSLLLKHSGPFRAWIYVYDLTVIDLSTNREQFYTLNYYVGSLNRVLHMEEPNSNKEVYYPIDDVPMPEWSIEDIFLFIFSVINFMMMNALLMPLNCSYMIDVMAVMSSALGGGSMVFFLEWLLYYHLRWNQDRREYFNDYQKGNNMACLPSEKWVRIVVGIVFSLAGVYSISLSLNVNQLKESLVWLLVVVDSVTLVLGLWIVSHNAEIGKSIVDLGLKMKGIETVPTGMRYSEIVSSSRTKSNSTSDDGNSSHASMASKMASQMVGPRSSVKSFGFDTSAGSPALTLLTGHNSDGSRASQHGATPSHLSTMAHSRSSNNRSISRDKQSHIK